MDKKSKRIRYIKFGTVAVLYILWVIWMENYWLLLGLPILFDIYVSKKVHWAFWKPRKKVSKQKKVILEWTDALIFAVVVSTFIKIFIFELYAIPTPSLEKTLLVGDRLVVSKTSYGPRLPNTPVYLPFVHNTLPLTKSTNSYIEAILMPYKRLAGLSEIENYDLVVFNFPAGDTILVGHENPDYYTWIRQLGKDVIESNYEIKSRPVDRRENYVKRCVAIAGDTMTIIDGQIFINGEKEPAFKGIQYDYVITTNGSSINPKVLERMDIAKDDITIVRSDTYVMPLTKEKYEKMKSMPVIKSVQRLNKLQPADSSNVFPFNPNYNWTKDNFGPLWIPERGTTVKLTMKTLPLYERVISAYEENTLEVKDSVIYINGEKADSYTFKMNYYYMIGDNRDNSLDARMWGFVPEDHIVGKPVMVFFSLDKDKSFPRSIRWDRIFKIIRKKDMLE